MQDTQQIDRFCPICGAYHGPGPCITPRSTAPDSAQKLYQSLAVAFLVVGVVLVSLGLTVGDGLRSTAVLLGGLSGLLSAGTLLLARRSAEA